MQNPPIQKRQLNNIDINKYYDGVSRTMAVLDPPIMNQLHMVMGMSTEVGELMDIFKKYIAYNKKIDWVNAQEELGDLMFYVLAFCVLNGFDFEKILEQNFQKLKIRYPEKFTEINAKQRDLEKERKILEELGYKE